MTGLLAAYERLVGSGQLRPDPDQRRAAEAQVVEDEVFVGIIRDLLQPPRRGRVVAGEVIRDGARSDLLLLRRPATNS